jgi:isoquinoline 1-oxidoreductase alpha subunit
MSDITLLVNGSRHTVQVEPETPLLWVLRDTLSLTGAKFGCGMALCGACTVYVNGQPVRACVTPVSSVAGHAITTIEGQSDAVFAAVQQAWVAHDVPQCGYCQAGQVMVAAALLRQNAKPTDADIDRAMQGNVCRCGTYARIRAAIHAAAAQLSGATPAGEQAAARLSSPGKGA